MPTASSDAGSSGAMGRTVRTGESGHLPEQRSRSAGLSHPHRASRKSSGDRRQAGRSVDSHPWGWGEGGVLHGQTGYRGGPPEVRRVALCDRRLWVGASAAKGRRWWWGGRRQQSGLEPPVLVAWGEGDCQVLRGGHSSPATWDTCRTRALLASWWEPEELRPLTENHSSGQFIKKKEKTPNDTLYHTHKMTVWSPRHSFFPPCWRLGPGE